MKKSPSKTKTSTSAKPSKETIAVIKIQKIARGFLAKKKLALKKKEKQEYNELIEKLQKQVLLYYVIYFYVLPYASSLKVNIEVNLPSVFQSMQQFSRAKYDRN